MWRSVKSRSLDNTLMGALLGHLSWSVNNPLGRSLWASWSAGFYGLRCLLNKLKEQGFFIGREL